jgi:1,4-dihydroxy-2-naphthoate octaprenyltransferase
MNLNQLKNPLTCFIGSIVLMGFIYSVFFGVEEIIEAFAVMLGFISVISWKPIYFIFGSIVLFLQCMIYNNAKGKYKLSLFITLGLLLLFSVLCFISNSEAFNWRAVIYSLLILSISQLVIILKNLRPDHEDYKENKIGCMLFIGIFTVSLFVTLFAEKKEESSDKEQNAEHISQQDKIAQEKAFTQLKEVEDKYQKHLLN